ncbi:putative secreted protein [Tritonibacter multivorans]|uniref:Putative secreted protein n=1 Tax=Tritonibacter multivorans TaxID=928856 RepID=A0A0P1GXS6_9RHOB|nr:DUF1223 domain-containing protein [Tritonibacter multivorans]MDA7420480.1 DUF1223 domain-containing protein [Tritonibacter multivorans]CUH81517.1 putative secreted protein [Tritonibacter multivorans]SFC37190.1 hypothetical protein SAMN04488049_102301 [Tritonibacter multivorans]
MRRTGQSLGLILAALTASFAVPSWAEPTRHGPVVVELFTSQGCSSCPPADALLHDLQDSPDVLPLALHVDYWDYIGWKDSFARPAHADRQRVYAHHGGRNMIYTPQMVIMGQQDVVGADVRALRAAIAVHDGQAAPVAMELKGASNELLLTPAPGAAALPALDVVLVRYARAQSVKILRGELAGHELSYANIVTDMVPLARWDGQSDLSVALEPAADGLEEAVFIQEAGGGRILLSARR